MARARSTGAMAFLECFPLCSTISPQRSIRVRRQAAEGCRRPRPGGFGSRAVLVVRPRSGDSIGEDDRYVSRAAAARELGRGEHTPEAGVMIRVVLPGGESTRRPAGGPNSGPTTASNRVGGNVRARLARTTPRISLEAARILTIPVPTQFHHVPRHVVKPVSIRCKISHRTRVGENAVVESRVKAPRWVEIVGVAILRVG